MSEENKKDKKSTIDKVLMGAVIGGAIGSVIGAVVAPQEGKETRKEIVGAAQKVKTTGKNIFDKVKNFFKKRQDKKEALAEKPSLKANQSDGHQKSSATSENFSSHQNLTTESKHEIPQGK